MNKINHIKKFGVVGLLCGLLFIGLSARYIYGNEDNFPGSNGDPLITKSYLDDRLSSVRSGKGFRKIVLKKNSELQFSEGTEFLVYKGSGRVTGESGLINVSKGVMFEKGNSLVKYHLFLAPDEKCGILADARMTVFLSGEYKIKK